MYVASSGGSAEFSSRSTISHTLSTNVVSLRAETPRLTVTIEQSFAIVRFLTISVFVVIVIVKLRREEEDACVVRCAGRDMP